MRTMVKTKRVLALSAAAAVLMGGVLVGSTSTLKAGAYTKDDLEENPLTAVTPDSLPKMDHQGLRGEGGGITSPNFEDPGCVQDRRDYGGPWAFACLKDIIDGYWWPEDGPNYMRPITDEDVAPYSTGELVTINDAVEGMGQIAGLGDPITTALKITIGQDNQSALNDAITYNRVDDMLYGAGEKEAHYFTAWVKAEQDMWFDVGFSFSASEGSAQVYWDLGRRFFVPAGQWTQIGIDEDGNYLPFRTKVTEDEFLRGVGAEANENNSNCVAEPDETKGDTTFREYYRPAYSNVWTALRIYAYSGETYGETGVGAPAAGHGLKKDDSYMITGTNFWNASAAVPNVEIGVKSVTLDKTTATMAVGDQLKLNATVAPDNATDKGILWDTSDAEIATVDNEGNVTALKAGEVTIMADSRDGNASATCTITVTAPATNPGDDDNNNDNNDNNNNDDGNKDEGKKGCGSSIVGLGAVGLGTVAIAGIVMVARKKND